MTSEGEIYVWTKRLFGGGGWTLLAGDPPRGTDVPRLEIKQPGGPDQSRTKNKNAVINDLVYCKDGLLALVECKDSGRKISDDIEKLTRLKDDRAWRESLISAMTDRSLFTREGAPPVERIRDGDAIVPVVSYPGEPRPGLSRFVQITFESGDGEVEIGRDISRRASRALAGLTNQ